MLEGYVAPDLATEISGRIECVADDLMRRTIESLQGAACLTAREPETAWRKERRGREWH